MHYRETLNIGGKQLDYIGVYIKLYGLTDTLIDFHYIELLRSGVISTAASIAGVSSERTNGRTDKQLKCIAETAEGRRILSRYAYWGSNAHLASRGHYCEAPDWYIDPEGPTGYVVHDKMYSKYLYQPLSREEFYRRNVGRDIPEEPSAFTSIFKGVSGLFTNALGLSRLLTPDPPPEVIPVRERLDLGLTSPAGRADAASVPLPDTDDRDLDSDYESPAGRAESPAGRAESPAGRAEEAPAEEEATEGVEEEVKEKPAAKEEAAEEEFDPLPTISKDVVVPTDKAEYERFIDRAIAHITVGLERIDTAEQDELNQFAKQLDVKMAGRTIAAKRIFMKAVLIRQTARLTKSDVTAFNDLLTYQSIAGVDRLPLAPDTVSKVEVGLDVISRKLTFDDLKAYASIHNMQGSSKLKIDALRKRVLGHYIGRVAEEFLTPTERKKFKPDKHKKEYGII